VSCLHLTSEDRCAIHDGLLDGGWLGCVSYDCFGAGQQVTQVAYGGLTWRDLPERTAEVFEVFEIVQGLHEMRFLLGDPACVASSYAGQAAALDAELERLAASTPERLVGADLGGWRERAGDLFAAVAAERGGHDYRGALLLGADLRGADLTDANLLGADLRGADLRGADLSGALFLTLAQVSAASGDATTRLPDRVGRPAHWSARRSAEVNDR